MGSGFSKMKKKARQVEQQIELLKNNLQNKILEGSSGNGLVVVTLNGEKALQSIKIKPECVDPTDVEGLQDLIKEAFMVAFQKAEEETEGLPF